MQPIRLSVQFELMVSSLSRLLVIDVPFGLCLAIGRSVLVCCLGHTAVNFLGDKFGDV